MTILKEKCMHMTADMFHNTIMDERANTFSRLHLLPLKMCSAVCECSQFDLGDAAQLHCSLSNYGLPW